MPGFAQQQAEIVTHGLHRDVLHGFDVGAFGQFVLFRGDLLVPPEAVVGKERLGIGKRDRLRIIGFRFLGGELVEAVERRIEPEGAARQGDILLDGESQCVLQVVVLQITHLSGVVILQQAQRTVETQHLAAQVERRKPASLVGAERPVRGEKRIFGDHRGDRMVLRRIDRLVERQAELNLSPARNPLPNRIRRQGQGCPGLRRGRDRDTCTNDKYQRTSYRYEFHRLLQ